MRGELESVCQTVSANKSEAEIESTNDNQKKAPVRWYVRKITSYLSIRTRRVIFIWIMIEDSAAHHLAFAGSVLIDSCLLVNIVYIAVYQSQNWRTLAVMLSLTPIANGMPDWCRGHLATWHEDCGVSSSATQHTTAHHTRNKFQHIKRKYFNKWLSFCSFKAGGNKTFLKTC